MGRIAAALRRRRGTGGGGGAAGVLVLYAPLSGLAYVPVSVVLAEQTGMTGPQVGLTVGAHSLAAAVGSLVAGPALDLHPVRRVLPLTLVVNGLASLALCLPPTYGLLLAGRLVTGFTSAVVMLCAYVLVSDAARHEDVRRDRALSLMQTFMSVGAASALGLGALAASVGRPRWVFGVLACYGVGMLAVALRSRLGAAPAPDAVDGVRPDPGQVVRDIGGLARQRRVLALMLGSVVLGLVIQGSHFGVSLLLQERSATISTAERVLLSVLIPVGVFVGSSVNRRLLRRFSREPLYRGLYVLLPLPVLAYAGAVALVGEVAQAVCLLLVGALLGAMMPLSTALGVGWFPALRGSATAAEALARGAGSTLGPVAVGAVAAAWTSPVAALAVAAAAVVGLAASRGVRTGDRPEPGRPDPASDADLTTGGAASPAPGAAPPALRPPGS